MTFLGSELWACGSALIAWLRQMERLSKTSTTDRTRNPTKELCPSQVVSGQLTNVEAKRSARLFW